ncbi:MAG TPA: maltose alpha-D-glucosyltransferase [Anaerolineae bacterium]|nr:maltose alpha-D-glucosyltransferase [Anaerolineae bacterium]HQI84297.1 maltose alpha-D-glucosyltransferase [Anaerolineae bacterium]
MLDWYKDAIFYEVSVKAFADSNGDGIGDLRGMIGKLDYLRDLGVDAVWLLPIFPSPLRDDGYDVADYTTIHPNFGTLDDFKALLVEAHKRDLRIIVELVVNHTSDQHPWFQASRDPQHPEHARYRDWYVWSDTDQPYAETRIIFIDTEPSNWTFDPVRGQYFWHRFFSHQPDLNYDNPEVQKAMLRIVQYWIDLGVDGFRIDAPPYLYEREGTNCENLPETHAYLKRLRAFVDAYAPGTFLLSEANMWPEDVIQYFGDGDEVHMNYHFPLMPRIFMALAQADRAPILAIMARTPELPAPCQWGTFLRCHDELTLEMVTPEDRAFMWDFYAPEPRMRLNLGIRRRLAPLLENDRRRIEVANSLLLTLIGSPFIYYGDEIGMGDNIWLNDRDGVRTPMQWDAGPNAGFSDAPAARLYAPVIDDAVFGYQQVNVAAQRADQASLWHWMQRVLSIRKQHPVFGRGTLQFLTPANPAILAYLRSDATETILVLNNLSAESQHGAVDLSAYTGAVPRDLLGGVVQEPIGATPYTFALAPYGYCWLAL